MKKRSVSKSGARRKGEAVKQAVKQVLAPANANAGYRLTKADIGERLKVTQRTVNRLMERGCPHIRFSHKLVRFHWPRFPFMHQVKKLEIARQ